MRSVFFLPQALIWSFCIVIIDEGIACDRLFGAKGVMIGGRSDRITLILIKQH